MVKKIRVIEHDIDDDLPALKEGDYQKYVMEIAKSADWKLWEILQVLQRLEKKINSIDFSDDDK